MLLITVVTGCTCHAEGLPRLTLARHKTALALTTASAGGLVLGSNSLSMLTVKSPYCVLNRSTPSLITSVL